MTFFLTITLLLSCAGLVVLLALKRYELTSGRLLMSGMRPKVGGVAHAGVMFVESVLPSLVVRWIQQLIVAARALAHKALARGILLFEHVLHRMLVSVRDMTTHAPSSGGPASAFLREVAEHKRTLQRRSSDKRAIFDEE